MKCCIQVLFLLLSALSAATGNSGYTITIRLSRLPDSKIFLASLKGDAYKITDTAEIKDNVCVFSIGSNALPGMYRIIPENSLIQSRRNAPMNTIDIIFNRENISIKTVYPWLQDSLVILQSEENKTYFNFLIHENRIQKKLEMLRNLLTQYPSDDELYGSVIQRYNDLQKEKQQLITQTCAMHKGSFASALIAMHKTPFMDAGLSEADQQSFYKQHYFDEIDYSNKDLIHSNAYTHHVVRYIMLYRDPALSQPELENEFMKAADEVLAHANKDPEVYDFVLNYLMEGFERLKLDNVLKTISDKYLNTVCMTDESSTLLRRMESYSKLAVGMQAPDIAIRNPMNQEIRLSAIEKPYTLVVFWASWCPSCEELMPKLKTWYGSRKTDFEILTVSLDSIRSDWKETIEKNGYQFLNGCDLMSWNGKAVGDYFVYATPSLFLLDRSRKILAKPLTFEDFQKAAGL